MHGGDDGQGSLHQMAPRVFEDEGEVPGGDSCFGVSIVCANVIGGEIAEVFDQDLLRQSQETEVGLELVVVAWRLDVAAVEPIHKELE